MENTNYMKKFNKYSFLILILIATGCGIPSVHPLYEPGDLITNDNLNGVWQRSDGSFRFHVMQLSALKLHLLETEMQNAAIVQNIDGLGGDLAMDTDLGIVEYLEELEKEGRGKLYLIQYESNPEDIYLGGLVELAGNHYFDLYKIDFGASEFRYPVHLFMKSTISDSLLTMHSFSENWLKEQIKNRQIRIQVEVNIDDKFLITAPTRDLKKFVEKYGSIEEAYRHTQEYRKISSEPKFQFELYDEE